MEPILIASAVLALGRYLARGAGSNSPIAVMPGPASEPPPAVPGLPVLPPYIPPPPSPPAPVSVPEAPRNKPGRPRIDDLTPPEAPGPALPPTAKTSTSATTPDRGQITPPAPQPGATPSGVASQVKDRARLDQAAEAGKSLLAALKAQGKSTPRKLVIAFQRLAGLKPDGIYGPKTAGAHQWYTGESVPPFTGKGFQPYAPPF
ncbi:MAG: peptidoglycan-binding domain-containing protein [Myxococcota bacterium]